MRNSSDPRHLARGATLACVLALAMSTASRGDLTTYQYGGMITRADASTGATAGMSFSGSFLYDLVQGPSSTEEVSYGRNYEFGSVSTQAATQYTTGLDAAVGGRSVMERSGDLTLSLFGPGAFGTGPGTPQTYLAIGASDSFGTGAISVQLLFLNTDHAVYSTLDAPASISLGDFTSAEFEVVQNVGRGQYLKLYEGIILNLASIVTPSVVPEPGSLVLLGIAVAGAGYGRRWWHRPRRPVAA